MSKLGGARQELNETLYWLELLGDSEIVAQQRLTDLVGEARQLLALLTASINTARRRST